MPETHAQSEQDFMHEQLFYEEIHFKKPAWLLPHKLIEVNLIPQLGHSLGKVLILPDSDVWFGSLARESDLTDVYHKIWFAINKLAELHELGWIHGDVKAEHFRRFQQKPYLIDFEKARSILSCDTVMDATPRYMAPELFRGGGKGIQSDLYALGIVLYEWLTQTRLEAGSYRDWAILHCQNLTIQLPAQFLIFYSLLAGLLQKRQQNRFSNADEAINCLKQIQIDKNH
ncbi:protein kinase [Acinetobacter pittii]|uniref:Protein kinase n=1 Tax=Acinetobacter pittii TaxID=48296 RepID=A0AB37TC28_ACIPI|nr:tyrosine kinase family protein [Acinetobacter sp. 1295259]OTL83609.1 protein kinase [Acinetobacter pittii]EXA98898.1 tyrosine kinase family protein [Acinetobacter sp. 1295259]OTM74525.1 protein kinase [Acinetobacter pittii]OTU31824.1 protein kinase [Acinetobacter pittii]